MFILQSSSLRLLLVSSLMWTTVFAAKEKPGCSRSCGNVAIPYPFGIEEGCFLKEDFRKICDTSFDSPQPFLNIGMVFSGVLREQTREIVNISLSPPSITPNNWVASSCNISTDFVHPEGVGFYLSNTSFTLSYTQNKFTTIGCTAYSTMAVSLNITTHCPSTCENEEDLTDGVCAGVGCCQIGIPKGLKLFVIVVGNATFGKSGTCSYAFVAQENKYTFKASDIVGFNFLKRSRSVPFVLDWTIGNQTCEEAKGLTTYACQTNSTCIDSDNGPGYYCTFPKGYEGNPYLSPGCRDINECEGSSRCGNGICVNTPESYNCICPEATQGNGTSCYPVSRAAPVIQIALGVGFGLLALLIGISLIYFGFKKQKLKKQREKFFEENGGLLLQQNIGLHEHAMESQKIFSLEELEKATKKFSKSCIIGHGGNGTVYKGILADNQIVAIKKSKIIEKAQIEEFVNELVILTQINHRNVVKLLGCCLETEVPLLVYEFIPNGTLFQHLHCNNRTMMSWNDRLRIAMETASALSYLHSAASMPIIHRDIKSSNILLDYQHTAKVTDFGASKFIPINQTQITTLVQGTFGYLDPEYFLTSQLTEKSDVYSFGVVLAELLTGRMAVSFDQPEEERNLASYFILSMQQNRLFEILVQGLVNNKNIEDVKKVAELTKRCLKLTGEERPSMREVVVELEGLITFSSQPRARSNSDKNEEQFNDLYPYSPGTSSVFL